MAQQICPLADVAISTGSEFVPSALESTNTNPPVGPYNAEPRPRLSIAPSNGSVSVSWPLFAQDFRLEQSGLGASTMWSNAPHPKVTNVNGIGVSAATGAGANVFRLRK